MVTDQQTNWTRYFGQFYVSDFSDLTNIARIFPFTHHWTTQYIRGVLRSVSAADTKETVSSVKSRFDLYIY